MELLDYQTVWFIGKPGSKKIQAKQSSKPGTYNNGYDDD